MGLNNALSNLGASSTAAAAAAAAAAGIDSAFTQLRSLSEDRELSGIVGRAAGMCVSGPPLSPCRRSDAALAAPSLLACKCLLVARDGGSQV